MELISEPAFTEVVVQNIDIAFASGMLPPFTLRPEDTCDDDGDFIIITFARNGEVLTINRAHILWMSAQPCTIRTPVKDVPVTPTPS